MKRKRIDLGEEESAKRAESGPTAGSSTAVNPLTHRPFSPNYWKIFETRKTLPVYAQREEFRAMLASTQCMILVGETGSGTDRRAAAATKHARATRCHSSAAMLTCVPLCVCVFPLSPCRQDDSDPSVLRARWLHR